LAAAALAYALFLLWALGDHLLHRRALASWQRRVAAIEPAARLAHEDSTRWKTLRAAVDPGTYPLDLLAAVAAPTQEGKVRLTSFLMENGRLQVSGEATDVTQAYAFIEALRKSPPLREYDWTAGQPQLAGKNSVKYDMEATRATP
jgi:Tfp pilus assembly protein PilN